MNRAMRLTCAGVWIASLLCACSSAQSRKASYLAHGRAYLASSNYAKARVEFTNAAQIDPNDAEARFLLGQVAEKLGDARAALGQYQAAINADPKQTLARAAMGRLYLYGGLADRALQLVEPSLKTDPNNAQLLTVRGAARAQLGDASGATEDARMAVQLAPDDPYAVALLALMYKQRSEFGEATAAVQAGLTRAPASADLHAILAELELAQQRPAQAEVQLRRIVELEPGDLTHRYRLARFYLMQKNVDAAEQTLREAVSSQPQSVDAKLQLVELLAAQRGADQAATVVDRFFAAEPKNDELKLLLGEFLAQDDHGDDAERAFRAVIEHAGNGADGLAARDRLAALLIARHNTAAASALIAEVLKQNVRDNDALILRAEISLAQGQTQLAISDLRAVLRDQPNSVQLMRTLARAYRQNDEGDLAEQTLRAAVQLSPTDLQSRLDLAQVLLNANKLEQAEPLLEQLAKDNPSSIPVQESLFRVQSGQKHYADARATAKYIQRASPKQGLGHYLAGLTEELDQKPDQAAKEYEQALQQQPEAAEPLAALVRLDMSRKQTASAMARVNAVIARSPGNPMANKLNGELLLAQGQTDAAIAAFQDTVRVAPNWDQSYQGLALAQKAAKQYDDAVRTLQSGIQKTQGATILVGDLGRLYQSLGRASEAIALYEGLLAQNPNSLFAANNLAMLLVTYRQDRASVARAQSLAEQLAPSSDVSAIDTRGWVKFKSGDSHGAESLLRQAVDRQPTEPELHYHLAMAQLHSGEPQAAQQNLESALSSDRFFIGKDEARAALAQLKKVASVD